jgi:hypothetical protein
MRDLGLLRLLLGRLGGVARLRLLRKVLVGCRGGWLGDSRGSGSLMSGLGEGRGLECSRRRDEGR